ncbi:hypothetical protein CETAM_09260 [Corynebacterium comes]|uniref:SF3 helicase domain-containing protein n=2 Tax=Corynebacterium comes TaxID=2675218 RepID=A0A6B8W152_9CORY|nr:hypothetical protein CETAM_09260 [Corynebacterium comes]
MRVPEKEITPAVASNGGEQEKAPMGVGKSTLTSNDFTSEDIRETTPTTPGGSPLEIALRHASQGWAVLPLVGKRPLTPHGVKDASTDPDEISLMFEEYRGTATGVGGACGGRVVVDVDPRSGGKVPEGLPPTRTHYSGRGDGGCHLVYSLPEGAPGLKSSTSSLAEGVDIKTGAGSYVVLPGSTHPDTGGRYTMTDHEVQVAPPELLAKLRGGGQSSPDGQSLDSLLANPPVEGGRNEWLTCVAGHYAARKYPDREAYDHKLSEANRQLRDSLDPDEVAKVADSIWTAEHEKRRQKERDGQLAPDPYDPMAVARWLVQRLWTRDGIQTLRYWNGDWWEWNTSWWVPTGENGVRNKVALALEHALYEGKEGLSPWRPTPNKIANVVGMLETVCWLESAVSGGREWIATSTCDADALDLVPTSNGLLNWRTRELHPSTPAHFATWGVPCGYDPEATAPLWEEFTRTAYEPLARRVMAEWFGYVLSGDATRQKSLYLWGQGGTGKGTTHRVLERLLGAETNNTTVGAELKDLGSEFGAAHWVGKSLVCFTDAESGVQAGTQAVSRFKSMTGGDRVSINRKGKDYWQGVPSFRLMFLSNHAPAWRGNAKPMQRRLLVVQTTGELLPGGENDDLDERLVAELPGVLNWALDGLSRLVEQGDFTESETQEADLEAMLVSDVGVRTFVDEWLVPTTDPEKVTEYTRQDVFDQYKRWLEDVGGAYTKQLDAHQFHTEMKELGDPRVIASYVRRDGKRVRLITLSGLELPQATWRANR